jgi:phage/plasmid-like protein (TIGR03299 family)
MSEPSVTSLIGFTECRRPFAWGGRASLYPGPVPIEDVSERLFNWEAVSCPSYVEIGGAMKSDPAWRVILRSDTEATLGHVKKGYKIHQYPEWLVSNVEQLLDDDLEVGSAGLLRDGAMAWVSVEVPENIRTPEGVEFRPHLLAAAAHDTSLATTYKRAITLITCENKLSAALREDGQHVKVRHRKNSLGKLAEVREALGIVYETAEVFAAQVARLCAVKVTPTQWDALLDRFAPVKAEDGKRPTPAAVRKRETLQLMWTSDERVAPWQGTAFGAFQAVNTYQLHEARMHSDRQERNWIKTVGGDRERADAVTLKHISGVLGDPELARPLLTP